MNTLDLVSHQNVQRQHEYVLPTLPIFQIDGANTRLTKDRKMTFWLPWQILPTFHRRHHLPGLVTRNLLDLERDHAQGNFFVICGLSDKPAFSDDFIQTCEVQTCIGHHSQIVFFFFKWTSVKVQCTLGHSPHKVRLNIPIQFSSQTRFQDWTFLRWATGDGVVCQAHRRRCETSKQSVQSCAFDCVAF